MATKVIATGALPFASQGRLLQELGLRLVASPEIALVELIKNSYDADATNCTVSTSAGSEPTLTISDDGHGMTLDAFRDKWMQIATSSKSLNDATERYRRKLTGAKGIGRFAVRYLGDHLGLQSTAFDKARKQLTTLSATFDWSRFDDAPNLLDVRVPYTLVAAAPGCRPGTTLTISRLRVSEAVARSKPFRTEVLRVVSPLRGLDGSRFRDTTGRTNARGSDVDPGFNVTLPGEHTDDPHQLAELVLDRYWGRLIIDLTNDRLTMTVTFPSRRKPKVFSVPTDSPIVKGFYADIRFFPRRKGIFRDTDVDGREAWPWIRDNSGVAIIDHGFRIRPYGFKDDDWLNLDLDGAHNERNWRSVIARNNFPIPEHIRSRPGDNPALNLPHNTQLVGAVFIESNRSPGTIANNDLIPAMDREGLLDNLGMTCLRDYVRAGIEFLAVCDKEELARQAETQAKQAAALMHEEIESAISDIKGHEGLSVPEKTRLVRHYRGLAERLDQQEEYSSQSRRSLLVMSLLGVVAGFMTHESEQVLLELDKAVQELTTLARKQPSLRDSAAELAERLGRIRGFVDYSKLYIGSVGKGNDEPFVVAAQVRRVIERFRLFADPRRIEVRSEVPRDVMSPAMPVAAYSGVLLNLYSNALKSLLALKHDAESPLVVFRAWNDPGRHIIEVLDNGVGVPTAMKKRIWDPLFTTTAAADNPLGPGMGLGLSLVREVVREFGGSVAMIEPAPSGFNACFRVTYPLRRPRK